MFHSVSTVPDSIHICTRNDSHNAITFEEVSQSMCHSSLYFWFLLQYYTYILYMLYITNKSFLFDFGVKRSLSERATQSRRKVLHFYFSLTSSIEIFKGESKWKFNRWWEFFRLYAVCVCVTYTVSSPYGQPIQSGNAAENFYVSRIMPKSLTNMKALHNIMAGGLSVKGKIYFSSQHPDCWKEDFCWNVKTKRPCNYCRVRRTFK